MDTFEWMPDRRPQPDPHGPGEPGAGARRRRPASASSPTRRSTPSSALAGPDSGSPLLLSELRHLGGALGRPAENGGALSHLDAGYVMYSVGMPMTPELGEAIRGHLEQIDETMAPWAADGGYFNFAERPCDVDAILPAEVCARLAEVKRRTTRRPDRRQPRGRARRRPELAASASSAGRARIRVLEPLNGRIVLADQIGDRRWRPPRCPPAWPARSPRGRPSPWSGRRRP